MKNIITLSFLFVFATLAVLPGCKKSNPKPPPPSPSINNISPTSGLAGATVTINGANFDAAAANNTVKFNGFTASVTSASSTTLVVTAPPGGSTGKVTVTTPAGTATGPVFTYLLAPTITTISPTSAKAGTAITVTGANFDAVAANDIVKFNGTTAMVTSASATSLVVTAPAGGSTGAVTVTTSGGTATGPVFTYLLAPTITGISPASGSVGAPVTITGTNFDLTAANDIVKFNGTAAVVTTATATQLLVTVPAGGTTGGVTVTTAGGISNAFTFTYVASSGANLYIIGSDTRYGFGYWKNSTFTAVADWNNPYGLVGVGTDIYVAGTSTTNTPNYWKNSTAIQLSAQSGYTSSIAISGSDIYCLGMLNNAWTYWKNGVAHPITAILSDIIAGGTNGMAISSTGDVYVAGSRYLSGTVNTKATYWKNGTPVDLTDGSTSGARATAIFISGSDIYVAGTEDVMSGPGIVNKAPRLWKNGTSVPISTPGNSLFNQVTCLLVSGTDVYIGGQYNNAGAVWKNGAMISVSTYSAAQTVSSIALFNTSDLYITGSSSSSGNNCYWKNGNFVEMDPGCTVAGPHCAATAANQVIAMYVK